MAMQDFINNVKGAALGAAEIFVPVLKVFFLVRVESLSSFPVPSDGRFCGGVYEGPA